MGTTIYEGSRWHLPEIVELIARRLMGAYMFNESGLDSSSRHWDYIYKLSFHIRFLSHESAYRE